MSELAPMVIQQLPVSSSLTQYARCLTHRPGPIAAPPLEKPLNERGISSSQAPNGLKAEASRGQSPALNSIQFNGINDARQSPAAGNLHMLPPTNSSAGLTNGSPHPQALTNGIDPGGHTSATPFNSRTRQPGKGK